MDVRSPFLVVAVALCLSAAAAPASAASLQLGFLDDVQTGPPETAQPWLARAVASSADVVRISSGWGGLSPTRPAEPTNPADPAYNWAGLDQAVRGTAAAGLAPFVSLAGAPAWAEGAKKPAGPSVGGWKPDAKAFQAFAQALARRYDGTYPDPTNLGALLPRVKAFQPWNEPNLDLYLSPQWTRKGRTFTNTGPVIYRNLLNGFYRGIKAAQPSATVVSGGTAPFGDPQPGGRRTMPARFLRTMLCLDRKLRTTCRQTTRFDAIAHHPYSVGAPTRKALNPDDVSIPDLAKLTRPVAAAVRKGRALPRKSKPLWITEISYDSRGPDPDGVPLKTHARYVQQMLALLNRQGARVITWFQLRDQAPVPSYAATNQSGVYFRDGRAKPAQTAFAFPLVVTSATRRRAKLWLRAPTAGEIVIERRVSGRWQRVTSLRARRHAVIQRSVPRGRASAFRARQGAATSLAWRL
jgi:hypothetical protein